MIYAYFPGCKIPHHLPQHGESMKAVCSAFDIRLVELEFNCCGWPVRHENEVASVLSAARNFALAQQAGLSMVTPCKCCFGNLKHAQHRLTTDPVLAGKIQVLLAAEGLPMPKHFDIFHLLSVLDTDVGAKTIRERVTKPLTGTKVACHYGCHALRPSNITGFDDPLSPSIFERLVEATGAKTVNWDLRVECCGHPLRGRDDSISDRLMRKKLENAAESGASVVATACTYCQMQFDQHRCDPQFDDLRDAPSAVLFTQLLGLAIGLSPLELGLSNNRFPWTPTSL